MKAQFFDDFYQVSHRLASCRQIKKAHLLILSDTYNFNSRGMVNYKSQSTMANECGVSVRTVNTAISYLKANRLIKVVESGFKETLKLTVDKAALLQYIRDNEHKKVRDSFANSTSEDTEMLNESGWSDGDTQELPTRYANSAYPLSKTCVQKEHLEEHLKNPITPIQLSNESRAVLRDSEKHSLEKEPKYFIDQLEQSHYPLCVVAMEELKELKASWQNIYCGSQTIEDWADCEDTLKEIATSDEADDYEELDAVALFVRTTYLKRCTQRTSPIGLKFITALVDKIGVTYSLSVDYADLLGTDTEE